MVRKVRNVAWMACVGILISIVSTERVCVPPAIFLDVRDTSGMLLFLVIRIVGIADRFAFLVLRRIYFARFEWIRTPKDFLIVTKVGITVGAVLASVDALICFFREV